MWMVHLDCHGALYNKAKVGVACYRRELPIPRLPYAAHSYARSCAVLCLRPANTSLKERRKQ